MTQRKRRWITLAALGLVLSLAGCNFDSITGSDDSDSDSDTAGTGTGG